MALFDDLIARAHHVGALRAELERSDVLVTTVALAHIGRNDAISSECKSTFFDIVLVGMR